MVSRHRALVDIRHAAILSTLCAGAALAACGAGASSERPQPALPSGWQQAPSAPTAHTASFANQDGCLQSLGDELLARLIREARAASLDVRVAQARVTEARARARVAGAALLPTVSANVSSGIAGTTVDRPGDDTVRTSAGVDASWEIDAFGRARSLRDAASLDADVAVASVEDAQRLVSTEAARLYVEARRIQQRQAKTEATIAIQAELLQLAELARDAGLTDERDVLLARTALHRSGVELPVLDGALQQTALALDALLGAQPGTTEPRLRAAAGELAAPVAPVGLPSPEDLLPSRPDVRATELRAEAEVLRLRAARAARYPSFRLSSSIGVEALTQLGIGSGAGAAYSLLAGMTAPLFAGGRLNAQVQQQDAAVEVAWLAYEAAVLGSLIEVERALVAYRSAGEQRDRVGQIVLEAEATATLAEAQFDAGTVGFDAVLEAQANRAALWNSQIDTSSSEIAAFVALCGALGDGGTEPDHGVDTTETE